MSPRAQVRFAGVAVAEQDGEATMQRVPREACGSTLPRWVQGTGTLVRADRGRAALLTFVGCFRFFPFQA